jgi:hypothetical protein
MSAGNPTQSSSRPVIGTMESLGSVVFLGRLLFSLIFIM